MINSKLIKGLPSLVTIVGENLPTLLNIVTDSRNIKADQLFVAIEGEKFDGADYIESCLEKGVKRFALKMNERNINLAKILSDKNKELCFYFVSNVTSFLAEVAKAHLQYLRSRGEIVVIGVTGSNGKTTTKEMLFHLLNAAYPGQVHKTMGNFNNHIGVPLTIFAMEEHHKFAILEVGTNHHGEIKYLCDIINPDAGIITSIGDAHLEFLGSREGVFKEKSSLYYSVAQSKRPHFVTCGDDPFLKKLEMEKNVDLVGENFGNIRIKYRNNFELELSSPKGMNVCLKNDQLIGSHNFLDLSLAFVLCMRMAPEKEKIFLDAAMSFKPQNNRSELKNENGVLIFLDAYNANPSSMETSIISFKKFIITKGLNLDDSVFIVGDMNELGEFAEKGHIRIGQLMMNESIKNVVFVGRYFDFFKKGYSLPILASYKDVAEAKVHLKTMLKGATSVFVKASRSVGLESLFK